VQWKTPELRMGGGRAFVSGVPVDSIVGGLELRELFDHAVEFARTRDIGGGVVLPIVRKDYLVAMRLAAGAAQDKHDVEWLLKTIDGRERCVEFRTFVVSMIGYGGAVLLDEVARRMGHPGPGMQHRS